MLQAGKNDTMTVYPYRPALGCPPKNSPETDSTAVSHLDWCNNRQAGYTILESIVALFIFSCVAAAILGAIGTADKIRSRSSAVMNMTRIAENEFEHIRRKASFLEAIEDCTWVMKSGEREFQIERRVLIPDSIEYQNIEPSLLEIELCIMPRAADQRKYRFRMLQGYSW